MPVEVDPATIREFKTLDDFYSWLRKHHDKKRMVWIKIHKVGSGVDYSQGSYRRRSLLGLD